MTTLINKIIEGFKGNSVEEFLGSFLVFAIILIVLFAIRTTSAGKKKEKDEGEDEDT